MANPTRSGDGRYRMSLRYTWRVDYRLARTCFVDHYCSSHILKTHHFDSMETLREKVRPVTARSEAEIIIRKKLVNEGEHVWYLNADLRTGDQEMLEDLAEENLDELYPNWKNNA